MIETPVFSRAAVAAPHAAAAESGREILAAGGNAVEAMVAMAATIAVVYPHMNGIGGDGFWLVRSAEGRVRYIEAAGFAGAGATRERYAREGCDEIPPRGPLAALTVPGAIGGWALALSLSGAMGGRLPLDMLLADAIRHAKGYSASRSEATLAANAWEQLQSAPGFAATHLREGKTYPEGEHRSLPALAATLEHLSSAGLDDFYRGDVAREMAGDLDSLGGLVTRDDLRRFEARERAPLSLSLPDVTLYNAPPPTQGLASLLILGMADRLDLGRAETFRHQHGLIEATKRAIAIRNRVITDHDHMREDADAWLTPAAVAREADRIDMRRAAPFPMPPETGDTIWMGAVDGAGTAVSYIQSLYWEWGSGCVLPRTGVLMQNRGMSFSLDPAALNALQPGRRPFHTLNPPIAVFRDGRVMAYGSMGGDGQPQFQAQVFTRYARYGVGLAEAIERPRWLFGRTWGEGSTTLKVEDRFDDDVIRALESAGHEVARLGMPFSSAMGHAGGVVRFPNGRVEAAHDPRSDGGAAGL